MVYRLDRPAIGEERRLSITTCLHVERLRGQLAVTRQINGCRGRSWGWPALAGHAQASISVVPP